MTPERTGSGRGGVGAAAVAATITPVAGVILGVLVALAAASFLAPSLRANGGTLRVADHPMGEYRVWVYTAPTPPRPDSVDVSVLPLLAGEAVASGEIEVVVRGRPLERTAPADLGADTAAAAAAPAATTAPPGFRAVATREAADDPRYLAAKVRPGRSGPWRFTVELAGPRGEGSVAFELELREPGPLDRPWVVLVLALLPVAALAVWLLRP